MRQPGGRTGRAPGRADVGLDLPLGLRADPAGPRRPARLQGLVHHLRRRRLAPPGRDHRPRARHRHQEDVAPLDARPDQPGQVQAAGPDRLPGRRHLDLRPPHRRRLRPLPAADAGGQRHGLRRPAAQRRAPLRRAPRRARALPHPLHPHPHRRVPGHQRRAERAGRAAGRRPPQHRRGGGQRPVGLPVPGRRHLEHPRLRAGLPGRHGHHPRPELPLDPDHPRRRQRGHHQQRVPQAEDAVDRPGGGRPDRPLPGRGRARRGRVGGPRDRPTALRPGSAVGRRRRLLPDQRPERRPRGGHGPGRDPLQGRRRHQVLRPQGGQGRPRLSAGPGEPGRRGQLAAHRQRAQAGRG